MEAAREYSPGGSNGNVHYASFKDCSGVDGRQAQM